MLLSILDAFYSLPLFIYILLFLGGAWGVLYLLIKRTKPSSKTTSLLTIGLTLGSLIATPILLMVLNNSYWGYGYLHENKVSYFGVSNRYIAISDRKKGGQSRSIHRLYLVDAHNGIILFKKPVYENERVKSVSLLKNNQLLIKSGKKSLYLSLKGQTHQPFNKNRLKALPEFKEGIHQFGYNAHTHQVWTINTEGKKFFYNGTTLKREIERTTSTPSAHNFLALQPSKKAYFTTNKASDALHYCPLSLKGHIRQQLTLEDGQLADQSFIYGSLLQYFPKAQVALIKSYQTTYKKKLKLTVVNLQGKVVWQKTQEDLEVKDFFSDSKLKISYISPAIYEGDFVILMGGYLLRMNPKTGEVRWQARL